MTIAENHWKSLYATDREFYELCYQRTAEVYPRKHAAEPEAGPAALIADYNFQAMLTLNQIDGEAINAFAWGSCGYFALELHRLSGLPLALFTTGDDEWGWSGHAAVALPDGNFLDITGVATGAEINARYSFVDDYDLPEPIQATFPERDTYCETMFRSEGSGAQNPYADLEPLEIRLLQHFAELVLQKNGIGIPGAAQENSSRLELTVTGS